MNKNYILYKAENDINGSVYIGATTKSIEERKKDHLQRANKTYSSKLHEAISTYGAEAFIWEQIDTASSSDELAQKEKQYVLKFNAKEEGYNADSGGGFKKTVYQYDLKEGKLMNKYNSLENAGISIDAKKQDISRVCLSVNNMLKGYYWSYEFKEPFIPNKDLRKKKVLQFSIDGDFLDKYSSVSEASSITGISKSCISKVCRGDRKSSGGFLWEYI